MTQSSNISTLLTSADFFWYQNDTIRQYIDPIKIGSILWIFAGFKMTPSGNILTLSKSANFCWY